MKTVFWCCIFFVSSLSLKAQKNNSLNLTVGFGPNYIFNDESLNRKTGTTRIIGLNYLLQNKHQNLAFNPAITAQVHNYYTVMNKDQTVNVNQTLFGLNLDVLMKIHTRCLVRVGLYFNKLSSSSVSISQKLYNGTGYYGYGSSEMEKNYSPSAFQLGVILGVSIPFKLFGREQKFNVKYLHTASSIVNSDYWLPKILVGQDVKVLSQKARPSVLTLGFDFNFWKKKVKKKKIEEE